MQQYTNDIICYANERVSVRVRFPYKWNGEIGTHGKYYHKSLIVIIYRGMVAEVARKAHYLEVGGSNPSPTTLLEDTRGEQSRDTLM